MTVRIISTPFLSSLLLVTLACSQEDPRVEGGPSSDATSTTLSSSPAPPASIAIPTSLTLGPAERDALQQLARAPHFGGWAVGAAGSPTEPVRAWRVLLASPSAAQAFALVLEHGTLAGQLMALAGLYLADPQRFAAELPRYRAMKETVRVQTSGCAPGGDPVAVSVVIDSPTAVKLEGPDDSLSAWSQRNPGKSYEGFDIAGGGYSVVMRPRRPQPAPKASD